MASRGCGDLQKITRSFVYARQFSRFRIQSVTNSEKRRNSGRCGFSSELANAALRWRIQIRSSCMWLPHIPTCTYIHTHTHTHTHTHISASFHPFPASVYLFESVHPLLATAAEVATTNVRPSMIDRESLSMRRNRLLRFGLSRETKRIASNLFFMKVETFLSEKCSETRNLKFRRIYPSCISYVCLCHHDVNDRQLPSSRRISFAFHVRQIIELNCEEDSTGFRRPDLAQTPCIIKAIQDPWIRGRGN